MLKLRQQELIKQIIKMKGITRAEFAAQYGATPRAVASWLLPTEAEGYRNAPKSLLASLQDEIILRSDSNFLDVTDLVDESELNNLVVVNDGVQDIVFPPIYIQQALIAPSEETLSLFRQEGYLKEGVDSWTTTQVSLTKEKPHLADMASFKTEVLKKAVPLNILNGIDDKPTWTVLQRYNTPSECQAALDAYIISQPFSHVSGCLVKFRDGYFLLSCFTPDSERSNGQKSLLIYRVKTLKRWELDNSIYVDTSSVVFDEQGLVMGEDYAV
jgi:transcriptional regulator with XRE-family HTH domain